jgi:hypothetical protein
MPFSLLYAARVSRRNAKFKLTHYRRMNAMESEPINVEIHFRSASEQLTVTPLGDRIYRMEFGRLCASHPDNGDLIEADTLADGSLKFRRIVKRADFQRRGYLISKQTADSENFARLRESVIALGGRWELNFGGYLVLYLPPNVSFEAVEAAFPSWPRPDKR